MGECGAITLVGGACKQKIKGLEERCWQHRGPQCSVCFGTMNGQRAVRKLDCNHEFHTRCLDRWKLTCTGDPTCPMCRTPFDVPLYRCRVIIERVSDNHRTVNNFETNNVSSIIEGFGLDFRTLVPDNTGTFITDIHFDIDPGEAIQDILQELGLPSYPD